ncbi:hypothetical protein [Pectobacterium jejuense]|uniref:Immunity protein 43 domain-containing protein n=1 Tax=Pectobacterium jejuense TaxID=2974022 RepID=A0ABW8GXA7_9GAMM
MAFWQYSFWAVPKHALVSRYGNVPKKITEDDFNEIKWFSEFSQEDILIREINYLDNKKHWDKETVFFGDYDKDCIAIMFDGKELSEIKLRVDLRNSDLPILHSMIRSLCDRDLMIIDEDMNVIDPRSDILIQKINIDISKKNSFFKR